MTTMCLDFPFLSIPFLGLGRKTLPAEMGKKQF